MRGTDLEECLASAIGSIPIQPFSGEARRITYPFAF
jgi:hypothetical protein